MEIDGRTWYLRIDGRTCDLSQKTESTTYTRNEPAWSISSKFFVAFGGGGGGVRVQGLSFEVCVKNNCFADMQSGSKEGLNSRLMDLYITQL